MDNNRLAPFVLDSDGYHAATNRRYHGRLAELVTSDTEKGAAYRGALMPCVYLGNRLTADEGRRHALTLVQLGVKCNTCAGKRAEFHCSKHQFTNAGKCRECPDKTTEERTTDATGSSAEDGERPSDRGHP